MGNTDLATLIVVGVCVIGLIQLIMWIALVIRHPEGDGLRLELAEATSTHSRESPAPAKVTPPI